MSQPNMVLSRPAKQKAIWRVGKSCRQPKVIYNQKRKNNEMFDILFHLPHQICVPLKHLLIIIVIPYFF